MDYHFETIRQKICTYAILAILGCIVMGCGKNEVGSNGKVELFLLDSYTTLENSAQIDKESVKTKDLPLINYSDFISYNATNHTFVMSDDAIEAIKSIEHSVRGVAFGIKANDELIYTGYFWPILSSLSCDCIYIDPILIASGNKIVVNLGYPRSPQGQVIPDGRNDIRIIEIFKKDNKLVK